MICLLNEPLLTALIIISASESETMIKAGAEEYDVLLIKRQDSSHPQCDAPPLL
jgi:hypothetical protein